MTPLRPQVGADGAVAILDRARQPVFSIAPAKVLDLAGRDVTPAGAR